MKLETPEATAFVKLWIDYDPHVGFDLHTSDGRRHGYHLTYSPPLNPEHERRDHEDHEGRVVPVRDEEHQGEARLGHVLLRQRLAERRPRSWPRRRRRRGRRRTGAGGRSRRPPTPRPPAAEPPAPAWGTFEHVPRFHNNYVGMRNRFALLSEAYAYATFEDRIKATNYFIEEALKFAHRTPRVKKIVAAADKEAIVGKSWRPRAQIKRGGMIEILMGEVEDEKNPINGAVMSRRKDVVQARADGRHAVVRAHRDARPSPAEYYVPDGATKALELLRAHGVVMRPVTQPVKRRRAVHDHGQHGASGGTDSIDTGTHALRDARGARGAAAGATVPAGALAVAMNQPLAPPRVLPARADVRRRTDDWNYLDEMLGKDARCIRF